MCRLAFALLLIGAIVYSPLIIEQLWISAYGTSPSRNAGFQPPPPHPFVRHLNGEQLRPRSLSSLHRHPKYRWEYHYEHFDLHQLVNLEYYEHYFYSTVVEERLLGWNPASHPNTLQKMAKESKVFSDPVYVLIGSQPPYADITLVKMCPYYNVKNSRVPSLPLGYECLFVQPQDIGTTKGPCLRSSSEIPIEYVYGTVISNLSPLRPKGNHGSSLWVSFWSWIQSAGRGDVPWELHRPKTRVIHTMESAQYHKEIGKEDILAKFDYDNTYRLDADIPSFYFREDIDLDSNRWTVPFKDKVNALVFLNNNCDTHSGRERLVEYLETFQDKTNTSPWNTPEGIIHSYGSCRYNMERKEIGGPNFPRVDDKLELFGKYKFCIAIENSITYDYVSEKLWDALMAGCLPIVYGPRDLDKRFLPHPDAVIDISKFMDAHVFRECDRESIVRSPLLRGNCLPKFKSPYVDLVGRKLLDALEALAKDPALYEKHMAWREMDESKWGEGYRNILRVAREAKHSRCSICEIEIERRMRNWVRQNYDEVKGGDIQKEEIVLTDKKKSALQELKDGVALE
eukprot:Nk52_evm15s418 gene=Nk52_evmTU15s418